MSDAQENPSGYDPLGGGAGDDSPVDGGNPAIGPDAETPAETGERARREAGTAAGQDDEVPPRGFPEQ